MIIRNIYNSINSNLPSRTKLFMPQPDCYKRRRPSHTTSDSRYQLEQHPTQNLSESNLEIQ